MDGKESQCPIVVLKRGNGPPGPRGAKGVPRCGRGVGTTPRIPCLTSVSPRNHPVVWGTAIPQCDEPVAFNVHARICGSSREESLERPGPPSPDPAKPEHRVAAMTGQEKRWLDNVRKDFHESDTVLQAGTPQDRCLEELFKAVDTAKTLRRSLRGEDTSTR